MNQENIISIIEDFLKKLTIDFDSIEVKDNEINKTFLIKTNDAGVLIGNRGENLDALGFLIRRVVEKNTDKESNRSMFIVDVNNYQTKKLQEFTDSLNVSANKVRLFKQDVELSPMTSYERMIVHTTFSNDKDIKTESDGEGKFRKVVLKYISNNTETENF